QDGSRLNHQPSEEARRGRARRADGDGRPRPRPHPHPHPHPRLGPRLRPRPPPAPRTPSPSPPLVIPSGAPVTSNDSAMLRLLLLILLIAAHACDRPARDAAMDGAGVEADSLAARPPAAYERRMLFLAGPAARPVGALFDFATLHHGAGLRRAARAWVGRTDGWDSIFVATWDTEPVRVPWLLVPHRAFRLLVGDDGEIEALVHRGDRELRLVPAPHFASWSRGRGAQLLLRSAQLVRDGTSTPGVVLDVQLGRELPRAWPADRVAASGPA